MTRHTGGFAWAATSTRSRSSSRAMAKASGSGLMPICCPSCPTSRTSRARILSLIRGSPLAGGVAIAESSSCRRSYLLYAGCVSVTPPQNQKRRTSMKPTSASMRRKRAPATARFDRPDARSRGRVGAEAPLRFQLWGSGHGRGTPRHNPSPRPMSLWTPSGEHRPQPAADDEAPGDAATEELSPDEQAQLEAMRAEMAEVRKQLLDTPAEVVVANHAMGIYELAAIHLTAEQ